MDHMERFVPLAILAVIAAFVLILIRRGWRENAKLRPLESAKTARSQVVSVAAVVEAAPVVPEQSTKEPAPVTYAAAAGEHPTRTPVDKVLALLQEKDSLAVGFMLGEILGPPVSSRRR